jgi:hypothetical protein
MKQTIVKAVVGIVGMVVLVGCTQLFVAGQDDKSDVKSIQGVWQTVVTVRNCATGLPLPIPSFPGILMFSQGGTITGTSTSVTSAYGTWRRDPGPQEYSFAIFALKYDAGGVFIGSKKITQNVTLDDSGAAMTSNGGFQDYDAAGNPTISGCSTSTGTRFE